MMWYYGSGASTWMWAVGMLTMLVFWGGLAALVVWAVTGLTRRREGEGSADDPEAPPGGGPDLTA